MSSDCGLRLIIGNQFARSSVAVSPAPLPGYPAGNMLMTWRSRVMRTSGTVGQVITFSVPKTETADAFYCPVDGRCELRLELFSDTEMKNRVYDSGITRFGVQTQQLIPMGRWIAGVHAIGQTEGVVVGSARVLYFPPARYMAAKVTLDFPGADVGWIEVPYLAIGQSFQPGYGASYGLTLSGHSSRQRKRTRGGSLHRVGADRRWRSLSLDLSYLTDAERTRLEAELWDTGGTAVLVDAYPQDATSLHDHHLFLADVELPEMTHAGFDRHTTKLTFEEV